MACNPDILCTELFNLAKGNFNKSIGFKLLVYVTGVAALFITDKFSIIPVFALVLVILSELFQFRSDNFKRSSESLRRKLDFNNSFGWEIAPAELTDILTQVPVHIENKVESGKDVPYFASKQGIGPARAVDNLEESAWYSKHLATIAFNYCMGTLAFIIVGSVIVLYFAFNSHVDDQITAKISKIITSTIMIIFSLGLTRLAIGYYRFSNRSDRVEAQAISRIKAGTVSEVEAIKLWLEYHIARASSPLIPEIIWKRNKDRLNRLWQKHREK
jgi:hypothetical protein